VTRAPLNSVLPNLDTDLDHSPGRFLKRSSDLLSGGVDKLQRFRLDPAGSIRLNGPTSLVLFAAARDFRTDNMQVQATLLDCSDLLGLCSTFATATIAFTGSASQFVPVTFDFGSQTRTVVSSHNLELRIVVPSASDRDMWMAYDTTGLDSALNITP
jgi:hypothetical protein